MATTNGISENRKYQESDVVHSLMKKHDLKIKGKVIHVLHGDIPQAKNDIGVKSWGKIDYLTRRGYVVIRTRELPKH